MGRFTPLTVLPWRSLALKASTVAETLELLQYIVFTTLEFRVKELGVDHDLGFGQINDRLKVVHLLFLSNKNCGSKKNADDLGKDSLLFFKFGRRKVFHGFL